MVAASFILGLMSSDTTALILRGRSLSVSLVRHMKALLGVLQDATGKECGLHSGNVSESTDDAKAEATDLWVGTAVEALSKDQLAALKEGPRDKDTLVVLYAPWCQYSQVCSPRFPTCHLTEAPMLSRRLILVTVAHHSHTTVQNGHLARQQHSL